VSRGSRPTAKGQTHTLCRRKRRTSDQREQADGQRADSHPMQAQKEDQSAEGAGQRPRARLTRYAGAKGGPVSKGSRPMAKGQTHMLRRHKRRSSEQREQANSTGADSHPMQVQKEDQ
jgi:hypothetical protein